MIQKYKERHNMDVFLYGILENLLADQIKSDQRFDETI